MFSNNRSVKLYFKYFYIFILLLISKWTVIMIQVPISFKFFVQAIFCWLFACVYYIYCIVVNWSWKLSLYVIANRYWAIYKIYIRICSPAGLWKVLAKVVIFLLRLLQSSSSNYSSLICVGKCWLKGLVNNRLLLYSG